jgi:hypothetical protein
MTVSPWAREWSHLNLRDGGKLFEVQLAIPADVCPPHQLGRLVRGDRHPREVRKRGVELGGVDPARPRHEYYCYYVLSLCLTVSLFSAFESSDRKPLHVRNDSKWQCS